MDAPGGSGAGFSVPDRVVIASANAGKIKEVRDILEPLGVALLDRSDFGGWPEVEETGDTYEANARLKAAAICSFTGMPALADDSGIEVDALGGRPGVHSARFAGPGATDEANNALLVSMLEGVAPEERTARYRCVCVLLGPGGLELTGFGVCEGRIALEPAGSGGFGYDPWFIPEGEERTMAELPAAHKHAISHRGKALRALAAAWE